MKNSNYVNPELKRRAKAISIQDLLSLLGHQPIKSVGKELVYCSPLRNESTPSFFVDPSKNCFNDFGGTKEMNGDSIAFVRLYFKKNFQDAVKYLLDLDCTMPDSFSFSSNPVKLDLKSAISIIAVKELQHPALIQYIKKRKISIDLAMVYLKEVIYESNGRTYFAIGFQNNSGCYELRSKLDFKNKTTNDITTFECKSESVALFEGFFDFLSALEYSGKQYPACTTIVLNSCINLNKALPLLTNRKLIHSFLDNDEKGRETLQKLIIKGFTVKNWSDKLYPSCKDFNEYLIEYSKKRS